MEIFNQNNCIEDGLEFLIRNPTIHFVINDYHYRVWYLTHLFQICNNTKQVTCIQVPITGNASNQRYVPLMLCCNLE